VVFIDRSREKNAQGQDIDRTTEEVINRATIRGVFSNNFQITGVNPIEGRELALLLRAGGLAAPLSAVEERAIGPSLGQDNIDKGVHAMVFGMLAAFVFMAVYYKVFGLIADVVLAANVVLLTAFPVAGRSGVDAARHRGGGAHRRHGGRCQHPDLRARPRGAAQWRVAAGGHHGGLRPRVLGDCGLQCDRVDRGPCVVAIRGGAVRGFAVVLVIGIATSMFTSLMGSRALVQVIYGGKRKVERLSI